MTRTLPAAALAVASLLAGTAAFATTAKPAAKPAMTARTAPVAVHHTTTTSTHMVSTKTSTGKAITYDCSKAGNATKKACKKGA